MQSEVWLCKSEMQQDRKAACTLLPSGHQTSQWPTPDLLISTGAWQTSAPRLWQVLYSTVLAHTKSSYTQSSVQNGTNTKIVYLPFWGRPSVLTTSSGLDCGENWWSRVCSTLWVPRWFTLKCTTCIEQLQHWLQRWNFLFVSFFVFCMILHKDNLALLSTCLNWLTIQHKPLIKHVWDNCMDD